MDSEFLILIVTLFGLVASIILLIVYLVLLYQQPPLHMEINDNE